MTSIPALGQEPPSPAGYTVSNKDQTDLVTDFAALVTLLLAQLGADPQPAAHSIPTHQTLPKEAATPGATGQPGPGPSLALATLPAPLPLPGTQSATDGEQRSLPQQPGPSISKESTQGTLLASPSAQGNAKAVSAEAPAPASPQVDPKALPSMTTTGEGTAAHPQASGTKPSVGPLTPQTDANAKAMATLASAKGLERTAPPHQGYPPAGHPRWLDTPPGLETASVLWQEHADHAQRPLEALPAAPLRGDTGYPPKPISPPWPAAAPNETSASGEGGTLPLPLLPPTPSITHIDIPGPTPVPAITNLPEIAGQIVHRASLLVIGNSAVFSLHLEPPGLGKLRVKVSLSNHGLAVEMNTTTPHAQQALTTSVAELRDALSAKGMPVSDLTVTPEPSAWGLDTAAQHHGSGQPHEPIGHSAALGQPDAGAEGETREPLPPQGRVDIRV